MRNKSILILLFSLILNLSAFGQLSDGGIPPSFSQKIALRSATPSSVVNIPVNLDIDRLIWEDEIVEKNGGSARVAKILPVDVDIESTGDWVTISDSLKIWRQTIIAEGAKGLIISYKDFYIPEGGKLFIYNEDRSHILGAYTKRSHPEGGAFATEVIAGEKITLEYVASTITDESPRIVLEDVGYIYNTRTALVAYVPPINQSMHCMRNANCPEGSNWQNEKKGIVLLLIKEKLQSEWGACSGSLVNNTRRDGTPYVLSANHCFARDYPSKHDETIIYFNHEFPGCNNELIYPQTSQTLVGSELLVSTPIGNDKGAIRASDVVLLKLKDNIPLNYKVFFNGWDRRNIASSSGVVIHHPNYDVKKIIEYKKLLETSTYDDRAKNPNTGQIEGNLGAVNAFWKVQYAGVSVTQGGSSGAPIFSQEGLIVGTLTGGQTYCHLLLGYDFYGKFSYHWDYLEGSDQQLKGYLDPINEGNRTLKGFDPNNTSGLESQIIDNTPKEIVIFPTMADNEVHINTSSIISSVKVYDLAGRQVYTNSGYNASTTTIIVDGWQKGVYSVVVQTELKKLTEKFVKK